MDRAAEHAVGWPGACVLGVDEAGRGPWAGPVVAAAVYLPEGFDIVGLDDSKKLTEKRRAALFDRVSALPHGIGQASVAEIDTLNILAATLLAMRRAVDNFPQMADFVLVDGNRLPDWPYRSQALVKGDARCPSIAAASILAKVTRDRLMAALDLDFPGYGWAGNKGYGAKAHAEGLDRLGVTPHHRRSFAPVAKRLTAPACG